MSVRALFALSVVFLCSGMAAQQISVRPGKNGLMLRSQRQDVYYVPGPTPEAGRRPAVLFLPGDRGWAGKAVDMAQNMASWGYDVYGLDTNIYLTSFTGRTPLTEAQIADDILTLSSMVAPQRRVLLTGWSEGAGLAALAASAKSREPRYAGVVVWGLADRNVLAWRWKDNLSILTQSEPNEPTFFVKPHLASISPAPLAMLRATGDQFVSAAEAKALYDAAREPKKYVEVQATNHRFDGNDEGFYRELKGAFEWALPNSR